MTLTNMAKFNRFKRFANSAPDDKAKRDNAAEYGKQLHVIQLVNVK